MKLNVAVLNPAGNITLIVTTPVNREAYAEIAGKLLDISELHGEQVGFLTEPKQGGTVRLEMMGGEFCGNALRSVGYYHAVKSGAQGGAVVAAEISGCGNPLNVEVDLDNNTAKSQMPLPVSVNEITVNGRDAKAVVFEGIVHFIAETPMSDGLPAIDEAFLKAAVDHAINRLEPRPQA
jgi:diaminopimelate epimerase